MAHFSKIRRSITILCIVICGIQNIACNPSIDQQPSNDNNVDFTVEDDGTIVTAPAITQFGVVDDCVIGLVLVGPKNDNGWSQVHFEAAERVSAEFNCELITFESLNASASPDTTLLEVATIMINRGADLIIAAADTFEADANIVANKFPNIAVLQISGSNRLGETPPDNLANSHSMQEVSRYIAGCAAVQKALTVLGDEQQIRIGYLGPLINSETLRQASSSYLGARDCAIELGLDPESQLKFEVVWIGFWFNIPGVTLDPTEVSHDFIDRGTQVIISAIDTTEPIQVAASRYEQGTIAWSIGSHINSCNLGGDSCIGEQFYDWIITYRAHLEALTTHNWSARWELRAPIWSKFTSVEPGATTVGFKLNSLTEVERTFIIKTIENLAIDNAANLGSFPGWQGPLILEDGTVFATDNEIVSVFEVWYLPQLLKGIVGSSQ